jgi:hypothetical protein
MILSNVRIQNKKNPTKINQLLNINYLNITLASQKKKLNLV